MHGKCFSQGQFATVLIPSRNPISLKQLSRVILKKYIYELLYIIDCVYLRLKSTGEVMSELLIQKEFVTSADDNS